MIELLSALIERDSVKATLLITGNLEKSSPTMKQTNDAPRKGSVAGSRPATMWPFETAMDPIIQKHERKGTYALSLGMSAIAPPSTSANRGVRVSARQ